MIDAQSGQISVADNSTAALVYPTGGPGPVHRVNVTVTDAGIDGPKLSFTATVEIEVVDKNFPPRINGPFAFTLNENAEVGVEVGTVAGSDPDGRQEQILTYSLRPGGPNVNRPFPFEIETVAGVGTDGVGAGRIKVIAAEGGVDFEGPRLGRFNVYEAIVTATDNHPDSPLSASRTVRITLADVQEDPVFPMGETNANEYVLRVVEGEPAGTLVRGSEEGALRATDQDLADGFGDALSYSWGGNSAAAAAGMLQFHPSRVNQANLTLSRPLDHEQQAEHELLLLATDTAGNPDSAMVRLIVEDKNEPSVFQRVERADGSVLPEGAALEVRELAAGGTVVGRMIATDEDSGAWGRMQFSLDADASSSSFFAVDGSGVLRLAAGARLDWED